MKNKILFAVLFATLSLVLGGFASADIGSVGITPVGPSTVSGAVDVIRNIVKWVYTIFFIIAVLFIIMAAFTYLTAKGDPEKVKNARDQIIYAIVAIVVALLAISIDAAVSTFLSTGQ